MKVSQNKATKSHSRFRFHTKCSKCAGLGKNTRGLRCQTCLGGGYVLNGAGRQRFQEMQDAWLERLQA
jgi:DnaJ-class molecular chaperone